MSSSLSEMAGLMVRLRSYREDLLPLYHEQGDHAAYDVADANRRRDLRRLTELERSHPELINQAKEAAEKRWAEIKQQSR